MSTENRKNYLDNLKIGLTMLVVLHHAAEPYWPYSNWIYKPTNPEEVMPWIWHFLSVNASFFMGLYFFISGYFVPRSYDKQGAKTFIGKKLMRLGIPLIIVAGILSLLTGQKEVGHLWFVESLLVFCLVYVVGRKLGCLHNDDCEWKPCVWGLLIVAVVMGIGSMLIRACSPQDNWIWLLGFIHIEPAHYLQYVMMFGLGIAAYRFRWLDKMDNMTGAVSLSIGLSMAIGNYLRDGGAWNDFVNDYFGMYESIMCVFISTGLVWAFREWCDHTSRLIGTMAKLSYGAYVLHLFILIFIQNITDPIEMNVFCKFIVISVITIALSYFCTWILRKIPGVKKVL